MRWFWLVIALAACGDDTQLTVDAGSTIDGSPIDAPQPDAPDLDAPQFVPEPCRYLPQIFQGAKTYWEQLPSGAPKQFPPGVGPTPGPEVCCTVPPNMCPPDGITCCQPGPSEWQDPTWMALGFHIDVPHAYSYEFEPRNANGVVSFVARAYADLQCDQRLKAYELEGYVTPDGGVVGGTIYPWPTCPGN